MDFTKIWIVLLSILFVFSFFYLFIYFLVDALIQGDLIVLQSITLQIRAVIKYNKISGKIRANSNERIKTVNYV